MILVKIQKISEDYKEKVQRNDFDWIFSLAKFAKKDKFGYPHPKDEKFFNVGFSKS